MVVLKVKFLAGRFHVTPWGRNVNEGVPEWPPSPYRLARALIDTWKRRFPDWPADRILPILRLFSEKVVFALPEGVVTHTKSFLNSNEKNAEKKQLVFDASVAMGKEASLFIGFDGHLMPDDLDTFRQLASELNYLGRSESWAAISISDQEEQTWNCIPDPEDSDGRVEDVACLRGESEFTRTADSHVPRGRAKQSKKKKFNWLEAICKSSEDLLKEGWSDAPGIKWVRYSVPEYAIPRSKAVVRKSVFSHAKFALSSAVLPRVEETVSFAERIRLKLMGIHRRKQHGDPSLVSPVFSGKGKDGSPLKGHHHAFFLPLDEDGDGWIDHLLIASKHPFNQSELLALDSLRSVWQPDGKPDVDLALVSLSSVPPIAGVRNWVSATPFVTSRHYRKGRGNYYEWIESEVLRE